MKQKKVRIIIAGSRTFSSYPILSKYMFEVIKDMKASFPDYIAKDNIEIVSGGAYGADKTGEMWATKNKLPIKQFIPDWDGLGKRAGFVRNETMAKYASGESDGENTLGICVAFWDGKSKGTLSMMELAKKHQLILLVRQVRSNKGGK